MDRNRLLEVRNIIDDINKKGISEEIIKELYNILGNKEIPIYFSNFGFNTASFIPKSETICVNIEKSNKWLNNMINESLAYFDIKDKELMKSYLLVYLLSHEIEHSNQKLISEGKKEPKYEYEKYVYNDIFDVMKKKHYILPRPISLIKDLVRFTIYNINAYNYILERNASIEGYNKVASIANLSNEKDIVDYMISSRNAFMQIGYLNNSNGALKNTYEGLMMMRKYNKLVLPQELTIDEKARQGLELSSEECATMLKVLKKTMKFK